MASLDEVFGDLLNAPLPNDTENLQKIISQAREAETRAKVEIYTLRGKKGLAKLAQNFNDEPSPSFFKDETVVEDFENSPAILELRRQIELLKEMRRNEELEIERLKSTRDSRLQSQSSSTPVAPVIVETPTIDLSKDAIETSFEQVRDVPPQEFHAPVSFQQPPAQANALPVPSDPAPPPPAYTLQQSTGDQGSRIGSSGGGSGIFKKKKTKSGMTPPQSVVMKVLNASWDTGSSKSKKNNKVYTIQVSINGNTWKIIRSDENLLELNKKMTKIKAEGTPFPVLAKKTVKREQQGELASNVESYLNGLNTEVVFGPKREKSKLSYMKFFGPFGERDEGLGNYPGNAATEMEGWFIWKLGLGA